MKKNNRLPESRLWLLMGKKLAHEATQDQLIELEVLVQKNPDAHYVIEILTLWWDLAEKYGKEEAELAVMNLLQRLEKENEYYKVIKRYTLTVLSVA